ncbi:MAG: metallophosphoesterase [Thermoplasmatota archaeon]
MRVAVVALLMMWTFAGAGGQFQPDPFAPEAFTERTELTEAGTYEGAKRVLRFVQVSDAHILDDDAPYPMRQEILDPYITFFSTSAQRPHEEFTDEVLNAAIVTLNQEHAKDPFSFVLNTGDNIDNQQENELMRFLDNWEGTVTLKGPISGLECVPDGPYAPLDDTSNDVTDQCTSLPVEVAQNNTPLAPGLPWYSSFGNHDSLVQGNVPIEPTFQDIAAQSGRFLLDQPSYVRMHFKDAQSCSGGSPAGAPEDDFGHGFGFAADRLCDEDPDNDGYYAFSEAGVRFIVLDTVNDDFVTGNENLQGLFNPQETLGYDLIGGYAEGSVDGEQFAWLQEEIESNTDQLIVITSHHTVNSMFTEIGAAYCAPGVGCLEDLLEAAGYVTGSELTAYLNTQPHVVAWIGGHTHQHRIQDKGTFWNIETSSLIDRPQEARILEVWQSGEKGFMKLNRFGHDYQLSKDHLATDDQQDAAQDGTAADQDVLLWFDVPAGVSLTPQPDLPRSLSLSFSHTAGLGTQDLALVATDSRTGASVPGLNVTGELFHIAGQDSITVLPAGTPLVETGNAYVWNVTIEAARTHVAKIDVTDPAGIYPAATKTFSVAVLGEEMDEKEESPMPFLGILVLLVALVGLRQKR